MAAKRGEGESGLNQNANIDEEEKRVRFRVCKRTFVALFETRKVPVFIAARPDFVTGCFSLRGWVRRREMSAIDSYVPALSSDSPHSDIIVVKTQWC